MSGRNRVRMKAGDEKCARRQWLSRSAGTLLALGLWPGCARWAGGGSGEEFRFVVLNDTHFHTPECPAWFERVRASIRSHTPRPDFCFVVGDLAEHGTEAELGGMRDVLDSLGMRYHVVIGNHDQASVTDQSAWNSLFPKSLNYTFRHQGWQVVALDSTEGSAWQNTSIKQSTFSWLDEHLPRLRPAAPTLLFTHFPLGAGVTYRPQNADELLDRFRDFNLIAVFNGHFHGLTERQVGRASVTTNRCCSVSRNNHDGSKEKGYFLCTARPGQIVREFIAVPQT